ncbi:exosortase Q [Variovorax boronicumulans]
MSLATLAHHHPRVVDWAIRIDRTPAFGWLALQCAALAPTWVWMARRLKDGSDDPLGLVALVALAALAWQCRRELRASPRLGWLALASAGTVLATLLRTGGGGLPALPPLASGLVAVLSLAAGLLAFLPRGVAALPVAGLSVLALPLLSSLQFYAGYPLRVVTAEASRWLLAPGFEVAREGATLMVDGRLVIVDAPCSGVQMVWLGYFTACAVALWARRGDHAFLRRLPAVGLLVLAGNIVRNSVLIAFEGAGHALAPWAHNALGLVLLAAVCGAIARLMVPARVAPRIELDRPLPGLITAEGGRRVDTVR